MILCSLYGFLHPVSMAIASVPLKLKSVLRLFCHADAVPSNGVSNAVEVTLILISINQKKILNSVRINFRCLTL
jgi:hypothetical protein